MVGYRSHSPEPPGSPHTPVSMHWNGTAWPEIVVPDKFIDGGLDRVTMVGTEVWALEGDSHYNYPGRHALRYVGDGWQPVRDTPVDSIIDAATLSDGRPLVIGNDTAGRPIAAVGGR
ncbi:MAG: hypothetical protein J2P17_14645 [Mycobacterium sp.]|nr:hypothetical protein [Mycobacterium sp.]